MLCKKVQPLLSEYFDEALDHDTAIQVSQHLGQCVSCRREFDGIVALHKRLRSLSRVPAPDYLLSLVEHRMAQQPWRERLQNEFERYWSIVRTTEAMWYATRALGTVLAAVFFVVISSAITPFYIQVEGNIVPRTAYGHVGQKRTTLGQQVTMNVPKKLGFAPKPYKNAPAAINNLYLAEYGSQQNIDDGKDDDFAVVTMVDSRGAAKVETVLKRPSDSSLLRNFSEMIASARLRPAHENGLAVPSPLVFRYTRVFVSD